MGKTQAPFSCPLFLTHVRQRNPSSHFYFLLFLSFLLLCLHGSHLLMSLFSVCHYSPTHVCPLPAADSTSPTPGVPAATKSLKLMLRYWQVMGHGSTVHPHYSRLLSYVRLPSKHPPKLNLKSPTSIGSLPLRLRGGDRVRTIGLETLSSVLQTRKHTFTKENEQDNNISYTSLHHHTLPYVNWIRCC